MLLDGADGTFRRGADPAVRPSDQRPPPERSRPPAVLLKTKKPGVLPHDPPASHPWTGGVAQGYFYNLPLVIRKISS